ncbi:MAG: DUF58 domain-containing protein [Pelolinea sp.]|nr:DUF58 domain-containing protein [Pelolinea sp.]
MRINNRFYVIALISIVLFIFWIIFFDELLLSLWIELLLVIIFSWVTSNNSLKDIQVNRFSRKKILEIGKTFDERLEIKNNSKIPKFWLEIQDHSELLAKISSRVITGLGTNKISLFSSTVVLNKRGFYFLGPTELISGDPFGLFTCSKIFQHKNSLIVYPKISKLHRFPLLPADKTGGAALRLQTTHTTPQAAGVREYFPGDPLNRVHWPMTVKRDKLMVKEFDDDTQSSVWILLDAQRGKYARQDEIIEPAIDRNYVSIRKTNQFLLPKDSFEYAVSIAASITKYFLERNLTVGFACASESAYILPPEKGHRQLNKIFERLATIKDKGSLPFEQLIEKQVKNISKGSALILITTYLDQPNEIIMEMLHRKGFQVLSVILENNTFQSINNNPDGIRNKPSGSTIRISYGDDLEKVLFAG